MLSVVVNDVIMREPCLVREQRQWIAGTLMLEPLMDPALIYVTILEVELAPSSGSKNRVNPPHHHQEGLPV
jgi:hypothetical protein